MLEPSIALAIFVIFLLAGTVKGIIGLGLPTVSLGFLSVLFDLPSAMALMTVPSFATNFWQATVGNQARAALLRIWPFLIMATVTVWIGATALSQVNLSLLTGLLGGLVIAYAAIGLSGTRFSMSQRQAAWAGPILGIVNGILTGMTGSFVVPGVMYLQSLGLSRDVLIQAMGMLFTASTIALAVALHRNNLLTTELATASTLSVVPAVLGMMLGQGIRRNLSDVLFRRVFFLGLLVLGGYILTRSGFAFGL